MAEQEMTGQEAEQADLVKATTDTMSDDAGLAEEETKIADGDALVPVSSDPLAADQTEVLIGDAESSEDDRTRTMATYGKLDMKVGLSFKKLDFIVTDKTQVDGQKLILDNISGYVEPGKVLCILGPSGSGKTTLLQVLSGTLSHSNANNGEIFFHGNKKSEKKLSGDIMGFRGNAAYVPQEDMLTGSLTVRETLMSAAMLKKPKNEGSFSASDLDMVENTINELGLKTCRDVLIGNIFFKGCSGGQKRRVSIGVELMSQPNLLFLDEPTSGLDSTSSFKVMSIVSALAKKGHTVVLTIHQPSSRIFNMMCDNDMSMLVLEGGRTMYFGRCSEVADYMKEAGHAVPQFSNPCDHVLDVVNTDFEKSDKRANKLAERFSEKLLPGIYDRIDELNLAQRSEKLKTKQIQGVCGQVLILLRRNFLNHLREPTIYWMRIVMYSMLCIALGTLYWEIGVDDSSVQDRISILFFVAAFLTFMAISGMPAFVAERGIYLRERTNNHYSTLAYSIANFLSSLPWIFLISLLSSSFIYGMIQSRLGGEVFVVYLLNLFVALLVAESMMVAISATSRFFMVGLAIGAGMLGLYMIVCGFFLQPTNIPAAWKWVHYGVSFHTYSFRVFMINEFLDLPLDPNNTQWTSGNAVLKHYEMEENNIGFCFVVLFIMMFVYRVAFYGLLRFIEKRG